MLWRPKIQNIKQTKMKGTRCNIRTHLFINHFTTMLESSAKDSSVEDTATWNIALHLANNILRTSPSSVTICKTTQKKRAQILYFTNKNGTKKYLNSHTKHKGFFFFLFEIEASFVFSTFPFTIKSKEPYNPTFFSFFCRKFCKANSTKSKQKK